MNYANKQLFADSRACFTRATSSLHMRLLHALLALFFALRMPGECPAGAGPQVLPQGAAVGGAEPPTSMVNAGAGEASSALPLKRVRHAHAPRAGVARARAHVQYLMITVPVDTILIINKLQIIQLKRWCQIVQIS